MKLKLFDRIALAFSLTVFLLFYLYGRGLSRDEGYLLIQDGEGESLYSLDEDRRIVVRGPVGESVVVIEEGHAGFVHSDCKDQLCVQMGDIEHSGEWAACLPNQVFLMIEGGPEEEEIDEIVY